MFGVYAAVVALGLLLAAPLRAQDEVPDSPWLPDERLFQDPIASAREARFGTGLVWTDLFDLDGAPAEREAFHFRDPEDVVLDLQGLANLGGTLPLWQATPWDDGALQVGVQAGVFGRFRMEEPSKDAVATDWMVALPVEVVRGPVMLRGRILHRSSHLGDELMAKTGAERIEYGHEALDLTVAYDAGAGTRVYGGGAFIFRSNTEHLPVLWRRGRQDRAAVQVGAEVARYPWDKGRLGVVAGIDWQAAQRTGWMDAVSVVAGLSARGRERSMRIVARYFNGPSPLGEFFLTHESFWGVELVVEP